MTRGVIGLGGISISRRETSEPFGCRSAMLVGSPDLGTFRLKEVDIPSNIVLEEGCFYDLDG